MLREFKAPDLPFFQITDISAAQITKGLAGLHVPEKMRSHKGVSVSWKYRRITPRRPNSILLSHGER